MTKSRQAGLAFIFVTLVLDVLGIGIVIPILPELIATFRNGDLSAAARYYGWFVAMYAARSAPVRGWPHQRLCTSATALRRAATIVFSETTVWHNGRYLCPRLLRIDSCRPQ